MKKILFIATGGTIGSSDRGGIISADTDRCRVLELYHRTYGDETFEICSPIRILSENLRLVHWEVLLNYIRSLDLTDFKGIIVAHGSDTLSYSSSMLGLCLDFLPVPLVLTAANRVPDHPNSNALINVRGAVNLINQVSGGVYTLYRNEGESLTSLFVPTRLCEADRLHDRFTSYDDHPAAKMDDSGAITPCGDEFGKLAAQREPLGISKFSFPRRVLMLHPYPSLSYDEIPLSPSIGAVLHIGYHSATVAENALTLLSKCQAVHIPLYICSFKERNASLYESSGSLLGAGALPLYGLSNESAYAKLLIGINYFSDTLSAFMQNDLYLENTLA